MIVRDPRFLSACFKPCETKQKYVISALFQRLHLHAGVLCMHDAATVFMRAVIYAFMAEKIRDRSL